MQTKTGPAAVLILTLSGCFAPSAGDPEYLVETRNGESIYRFYVPGHAVTNGDGTFINMIERNSQGLCPQGYREISRKRVETYVVHGQRYEITIACPVQI
jgi:hypothetical protein